MIRNSLILTLGVLASPVLADTPKVVTDILPVHSLVSQVMLGVGEPTLIVKPGTSPHGATLRPSQARALQDADLVVWIGEELTPWLEKPLSALSGNAQSIALLDQEQTMRLEFRDLRDHDDEGHDLEGEGQDGHHDHEQDGDGDDDHATHDKASQDHDDHHHDGIDPHAWLDPANAQIWLGVIAEHLSRIDPDKAATYRANAQAGQARIATVSARLEQALAPLQGRAFAAFHDAHQYFEARYGLTLAGTVTDGDDKDPSPAQLAALRDQMAAQNVTCAIAGPSANSRLLDAAAEGRDLRLVTLDPLGVELPQGADLYPQMLWDMGQGFVSCLD